MKSSATTLAVVAAATFAWISPVSQRSEPVEAFGGEDYLVGNPWYHPAFTYSAASDVGFAPGAAASVAWHSDYIDSYAYNPLWWAEALVPDAILSSLFGYTDKQLDVNRPVGDDPSEAFDRYITSRSSHYDLATLHFDDLNTSNQVEATWYRYLTGTLAGLQWAAAHDDVAAAHNLLGVSLHAIQDFYSHSSWVDDPERRDATWLESDASERGALRTGTYETANLGFPHGDVDTTSSGLRVLAANVPGFTEFMNDLACAQGSPTSSLPMCESWHTSQGAASVTPQIKGQTLPAGLLYYEPAGVNLDARFLAGIGAEQRGLIDSDSRWINGMGGNLIAGSACDAWMQHLSDSYATYKYVTFDGEQGPAPAVAECNDVTDPLFAVATMLAAESSVQWLELIGQIIVQDAGLADFWERVAMEDSTLKATSQFERYDTLPFQFITAGTCLSGAHEGNCDGVTAPWLPSTDIDPAADQYFLRLAVKTSSALWSGTDADIVAKAGGREFILDYGRWESLLFAHNDFENGDAEVFTIGPFASLPESITLQNREIAVGDIFNALAKDLWESVRKLMVETCALYNCQDNVGQANVIVYPDELATLDLGGELDRALVVNGGGEGKYTMNVKVSKIAHNPSLGTSTYRFQVTNLKCNKESGWDQATASDEPFVYSILTATGAKQQYQAFPSVRGNFSGVDSGDTRVIGYNFTDVTVPDVDGALSFAIQIYESDNEPNIVRDQLWEEFLGVTPQWKSAIELIGMSIAADWKLGSLGVVAFSRGSETVRYGEVFPTQAVETWIDSGKSRTFALAGSDALTTLELPEQLTRPPMNPNPVFKSLTPARLADTRPGEQTIDGWSAGDGTVQAGSTYELKVAGRGGVPANADSVMLNVTAVFPSAPGYLTVYPCGADRPLASNVNYQAGDVAPNAVLAKIGANGKVCLYTKATTDMVVDVNGYVPVGGSPAAIVPTRLLETRSGPGETTVDGLFQGLGQQAADATLELKVAGRGGVPANADSVMLNVTAVFPSAPGYLTVYPCGADRPLASNVNYQAGDVAPNAVLAKIGANGKVCLYTKATTDMVVDVNGYVPVGGSPAAIVPTRLLETRSGPGETTVDGLFQGLGQQAADATLELKVAGRGGVPANADSVMLNVTAVFPSAPGYLTVYPCGADRPLASNVNYQAGDVAPNAVLAKIGANGKVCLYTKATTDMVVDVNGYG